MNSRHCARLSIVSGMATATYSKILAVRRKPSGTVYAWTWWSMSPSTARVPNKTLIACRVVREELPRKVRSCMVGRIRFESTLKSLRVVRFGSIARGAQRTTCSRIPLSSWQFVRNRKPAVDEAAARSPGARMPRSKSVGERGGHYRSREVHQARSPGKFRKLREKTAPKAVRTLKRVPHCTLGTSWRAMLVGIGGI